MNAEIFDDAYAHPPGTYRGPGLPTCCGCQNLRSKSQRDGTGGRFYWCARAQTDHWHKKPKAIDPRSPACLSWQPRVRA